MLLLPPITRKFLVDVAEADSFADDATVESFVADMQKAGLFGDATEDEIERLDGII
jgi:hypothetical protein